MSVLKVYKNKKWEVLYANEIALRLKKTANLSDIPDKKEARTNLEIEGDNITTHNHNSIYLPLIKESKDLANQVLQALDTVKREKLNASDAINQFLSKSAGGDLLNKIGALESNKMTKNQVQDLITTAVNALTTNNIKGLNELITRITNESANTGVRMNLSQNGYICFGSKFGNLTLQWGLRWNGNSHGHAGWIPFNTWYRYVFSININTYATNLDEDNLTQLYISSWDNNGFNMNGWHNPARGTLWIAIGMA